MLCIYIVGVVFTPDNSHIKLHVILCCAQCALKYAAVSCGREICTSNKSRCCGVNYYDNNGRSNGWNELAFSQDARGNPEYNTHEHAWSFFVRCVSGCRVRLD